jgi:LysR family transcriptional regulator, transcription activator of glutamate synthase operon
MQLRDLSWLSVLADVRHVTDTAAVLEVSQPTLSRALARVEAELGVRLFERVPTGVVPTQAGETVVAAAREMSARWEQVVSELAGRRDPESGVVRLAFLDSMATSLVPHLLRDFHAHAPRVRVLLTQEPGHEILADLDTGAVELAVTTPGDHAAHGWVPLQEERLVLVVPPSHRLRSRRRVRVAELAAEELVTTPVGFGSRALVDRLLADAGISPKVSFESADLATIEGLVAAGLGVALVPEQLAGQSGTVGIRLDAPAARRTIGLVWRTDRDLAPPAARFLAYVRTHHGKSPQRDRDTSGRDSAHRVVPDVLR